MTVDVAELFADVDLDLGLVSAELVFDAEILFGAEGGLAGERERGFLFGGVCS